MIAVVQRVKQAQVSVHGEIIGRCDEGLMVLLGVAAGDNEQDVRNLCQKLVKLRIFTDENDKMNRSIREIGGEMLVVSQFTLLADTSHGNRPSFTGAEQPSRANALYEYFIDCVKQENIPVQSGQFGADMQVTIINNGPVTLILNSADYRKAER